MSSRETPTTQPSGSPARPMTVEEADRRLQAPGSPFELAREDVLGVTMSVYKNRARSLRDLLAASAAHGDKDYIVFSDGRRWSYREHLRDVASVAAALRDRYGIGHGDPVAILSANTPEWILTYWATVSLGAVVIAMNGWWAEEEIQYGFDLSKPKLVLADRKRMERIAAVGAPCATLTFEDEFAPLLRHAPGAPLPTTPIAEDDPCLLLFTSGTTGRPKGALVSHRTLVGFTMSSFYIGARRALVEPPSGAAPGALLAPFPLFHLSGSMGSTTAGLAGGATTVWPTGRFDPAHTIELTLREGVTSWSGATTHIFRLVDHPDMAKLDPARFTQVGVGGSATTPELIRSVGERFPHLQDTIGSGYGSSETGGLVSYAHGFMLREKANCVGPPLPTVEIAILDDDGKLLPDGENGHIWVRSPLVMLEYLNNPKANAESFRHGRWVDTGDLGHMKDGRLHIESRLRDMIIRGGENVYPAEIENQIELHPDVAEVAVYGIPDRELGQRVKAVVVPKPGTAPDPEAIKAFAAKKLAYYKVPEVVEVRSEPLPRNATGKVMKHVLSGEGQNTFVED